MSKIIFSVLLIAIISGCMCNNFLEFDNSQSETKMVQISDNLQITQNEFLNFVYGVHLGFGFFKNLPFQNDCIITDPQIIEISKEIFNLVKSLTLKNAMDVLRAVTIRANDIIQIIAKISQGCQNWAKEVKAVYNRLLSTVQQKNYKKDLFYHSLMNMMNITDKTVEAVKLFFKKDYLISGNKGGELMKFIFFWTL